MNKNKIKRFFVKIMAPSYVRHLDDDFNFKIILHYIFFQKVLRINSHVPWPVHWTSYVGKIDNLTVPDNSKIKIGFTGGCYIQTIGNVKVGENVIIGMGSKIISANHDPQNFNNHNNSHVHIGSDVWIGANSVILPGVSIADGVIVGAGSVVAKSILEPRCVVVGNPAKIIKKL
ncbi:acyltransferase [Vibrio cyclitrophicus]